MSRSSIHRVKPEWREGAHIDAETYEAWYRASIENPDEFWGQHGRRIHWFKPYTKVKNTSFDGDVSIKWFEDGVTNVAYNCIDRHLETRADQTAILWEGDNPAEDKKITYRELYENVCRLANALKARGVKKGDRVTIYMPMIPETAYAMLACARIGAVHSVVFGGFSPEALKDRILDADCKVVITADEGLRGGKRVPLKKNTDIALASCPDVHTCLVVRRTAGEIQWHDKRDIWYHDLVGQQSDVCEPEVVDAEDPLFILYTSGSTGKPKGVLH